MRRNAGRGGVPGSRVGRRTALAAAILLAAWSGVAAACPYCAGSREAGSAYFMTAIGMGLLPIGFGVGLVIWLRRRYGARDENTDPGESTSRPKPRA